MCGRIVGVQARFQKDERGQASDHVREFPRLVLRDLASQDARLPVAEPLLKNLVAADCVLPDGYRDIRPVDVVVEVYVERLAAPESLDILGRQSEIPSPFADGGSLFLRKRARLAETLARHHYAFLLLNVPPSRRDSEAEGGLRAGDAPEQ